MMILRKYKTSKRNIIKKIKSNQVNDLFTIKSIEQLIIKKRGTVFQMPKKGEAIIALMSGGLDTTTVIGMLLECYKLNVYPLFINRNLPHKSRIVESVNFFSNYFSKKYPHQYNQPFEMSLSLPPLEIKKVLLRKENDIQEGKLRKGVALQPAFYAQYAVYYAKYLQETQGIKIRTVVGAWLPSNSEWYGYESITSLRSIMLNICCVDNDYAWQFTSLPMEKDLGFYFDKETLVKIGTEIHLPLEKTWTCFQGNRTHCGNCPPCGTRSDAFLKAGITDKTKYGDGLTILQRSRKYTKKAIKSIIRL